MQTKEHMEAKDKAPPSTADVEPDKPEKAEGPAKATAQRAMSQPQPTMPPVRAAEMLAAPQSMAGAAGQAQMMKSMQQSVGNARVARMANNAPLVQRQPDEKQGKGPASTSAPSYVTEDLKQKLAATILAESWPGQAEDIRWMYYNRVTDAKGEAGLKGSAAYSGKGLWYRIWLYMLGDTTYGKDALPKSQEFKGFATIADFCTKNGYMQTTAAKRAASVKLLVDALFAKPTSNPYQGWIGQGNLNDFNNKSQPKSLYWKQARAYYWLQQAGKVKDIYVKVLPAGKNTQVIFDARSIEKYYTSHALPDDVPLYKPAE